MSDAEGPALKNTRQCTATSKRTKKRCRGTAVTGYKVCRFHGARGGAPIKTGLHTKEAKAERLMNSKLMRQFLASAKELGAE